MTDPQVVIHKGLDGVIVDETKLSLVDGTRGYLLYSGYKIEDLAAHALYEEVVFLLWHGRLPDKQELEALRAQIASNAEIPKEVLKMLRSLPSDSNPMSVLRTAVSMLAQYDIDSEVMTPEANERKAIRLNGQVTSLVAAWPRIRKGLEPISPRHDFTVAQNYVYQLTGENPPSKEAVDAINTFMVLLTEHGMNVSTFTTRVIASSLSDMHSAITGAIGSLKGPLHGGANTEAMNMFLEIGSPENASTRRWTRVRRCCVNAPRRWPGPRAIRSGSRWRTSWPIWPARISTSSSATCTRTWTTTVRLCSTRWTFRWTCSHRCLR
jgi:citrate synthase